MVTGYDFLADAAKRVNAEFETALPGGATRHAHRGGRHPATKTPGTTTELRAKLFGSHHDLVYLAGHFSAKDTLAADFTDDPSRPRS